MKTKPWWFYLCAAMTACVCYMSHSIPQSMALAWDNLFMVFVLALMGMNKIAWLKRREAIIKQAAEDLAMGS